MNEYSQLKKGRGFNDKKVVAECIFITRKKQAMLKVKFNDKKGSD